MKKTNKIISILLITAMLLSVAPLTAFAATEAYSSLQSVPVVDYSDNVTQYFQDDNYLYKVTYSNLKNVTEVELWYDNYNQLRLHYTKADTEESYSNFLYRNKTTDLYYYTDLPKSSGTKISCQSFTEEISVNKDKPIVTITCLSVNAPAWAWDGTSSATAKFTSTDGKAYANVPATITKETVTEATDCKTKEQTNYIATVTFNGKTYTDTKSITGDFGCHNYADGVCDVCGYVCTHPNSPQTCLGFKCEECMVSDDTVNPSLHKMHITSQEGNVTVMTCEHCQGTLELTVKVRDKIYDGSVADFEYQAKWDLPGGINFDPEAYRNGERDYECVDAGKYTVKFVSVCFEEDLVYEFEIFKSDYSYTEPVAKDLTYNSKEQELIIAGTVEDAEMAYSLDAESWSTDIPKAKDPGNYVVYYKNAVSDANHYDFSGRVDVTIKECFHEKYTEGVCDNCSYECPHEGQTMTCDICGKVLHTHDWVYTASGNAITSTCSNANGACPNTNGGTLTIYAPADLYYDGSAKEIVIDNQLVNDESYILEYSTENGEAPVYSGAYTATVYVCDVSVSVDYEIIKRAPEADMFVYTAPENLVYDGTAKYAQVNVSDAVSGMGAVTVSYYKNGILTDPVDVGTYIVKVSTAESNEYYALNEVAIGSFTVEKKPVTVSATVPDRIYGDDYNADKSKVAITFDGVLDGDEVGYVVTDAYYHSHNVTDNARVQVVYNINGTDAGNYKFPEYGDWIAPYYPVEAVGRVLPRDIAEAQIALGNALTYNGTEQTQSIASVTVDGLEVTYTVSGNTATNVGVYELVITANGNFTGTKTALFEIAADTSGIDALTVDNVKSTDKEAIEAAANQIKNAATDLADDEKKAEYKAVEDKCKALLDKIAETEEKLEEIKDTENNFNPETVTSDDKATIEEKIAEIEAVNPDNLTDEQKAEYDEIKAGFETLLEEIEKAGSYVDSVGTELEMFDEERVTIFFEDEIEALKAKIDELLADENMGETEMAKLEEYKAQAEKLIDIINTPAEYISMRLFRFVWDALNWLSSHVVFIFNWIVSMF